MKNKAFFLVGFCSPCNTSRFVCISTYFSHGTKSKGAAHAFDFYEFLLLLLLLFFVSWQATRFHSSWNSIEVFINSYFFSDYIKNKYKNTKKLKSCLRLSSRRLLNIYDVIYMTKKNHSQGLRSCITKLFYFKWTCLWL